MIMPPASKSLAAARPERKHRVPLVRIGRIETHRSSSNAASCTDDLRQSAGPTLATNLVGLLVHLCHAHLALAQAVRLFQIR